MLGQSVGAKIGRFYDRSTDLWLHAWGEHMHHGYYADGNSGSAPDHQAAQVAMIEALLDWGRVPSSVQRILDAGCGVGASSRYLLQKYPQSSALGFTLSAVQAQRGQALNEAVKLQERCHIIADDLFQATAAQGPFDLIWSMESAEHIGDKQALLAHFHTLLAPGGQLLLATWCHRPTPPGLSSREVENLASIKKRYHLGDWISMPEIAGIAAASGFEQIRTADWSAAVAPFWKAVIKKSLMPRYWLHLLRSGRSTLRGVWAMRYMQRGFRQGSICYAVLSATKANSPKSEPS